MRKAGRAGSRGECIYTTYGIGNPRPMATVITRMMSSQQYFGLRRSVKSTCRTALIEVNFLTIKMALILGSLNSSATVIVVNAIST